MGHISSNIFCFINYFPIGKSIFDIIDSIIKKILEFSVDGSKFLFRNLANEDMFGRCLKNFPNDGINFFQFAFLVFQQ